jgi:ribonucleotide reductase alpha subunit
VYDKEIFNKYSKEEIDKANGFIDHERDFLFTYAGLRQVVDKYLGTRSERWSSIRNSAVHVYDDRFDYIRRIP